MDITLNKASLRERNSVDMLNFLRVAATMFVFLLHGRSYIEGIDDGFWLFTMFTNLPAWSGVWILFFLSGYLLQKGFLKNRYPVFESGKLRPKELLGFYLRRFMKIAPAYYVYLLIFVILRADNYFFSSPWTALKILTFTFNGNGGISGIGHLWYISVAMWLYVLAPFLYYIAEKFKSTKSLAVAFGVVVVCGLGIRCALRHTELGWYDFSYTFLPCNIDLFFGGMLACSITDRISAKKIAKTPIALKIISFLIFVAAVVYNCYIYWKEIYNIYQDIMPTVYILSCSFLLWQFDSEKNKRSRAVVSEVKKNPLRLIDCFSPITYAFYIFHIAAFKYVQSVLSLWNAYHGFSVYSRYIIFMGASFAISLLIGVIFTRMIAVFGTSKKKNT